MSLSLIEVPNNLVVYLADITTEHLTSDAIGLRAAADQITLTASENVVISGVDPGSLQKFVLPNSGVASTNLVTGNAVAQQTIASAVAFTGSAVDLGATTALKHGNYDQYDNRANATETGVFLTLGVNQTSQVFKFFLEGEATPVGATGTCVPNWLKILIPSAEVAMSISANITATSFVGTSMAYAENTWTLIRATGGNTAVTAMSNNIGIGVSTLSAGKSTSNDGRTVVSLFGTVPSPTGAASATQTVLIPVTITNSAFTGDAAKQFILMEVTVRLVICDAGTISFSCPDLINAD